MGMIFHVRARLFQCTLQKRERERFYITLAHNGLLDKCFWLFDSLNRFPFSLANSVVYPADNLYLFVYACISQDLI